MTGFEEVAVESARRWHAAIADHSEEPFVLRPPAPARAVIVVLHGGTGTAGEAGASWASAAEAGCAVVVPGRGQPVTSSSPHRRNWLDPATTGRAVSALVVPAITGGTAEVPILIAGFSAGGREALRIGLSGRPVAVRGLLLFGPGIPRLERRKELARAAAGRGLHISTWVGAEDELLGQVTELDSELRSAGVAVAEEVVPGVGHRMPDDLAERLPRAISVVLDG